jgi:ABC-2 type transport system permease protein
MNFLSLTGRNLKEVYRDPVTSITGLLLPIVFLILFASIEKKLPFELYTPLNLTPGIIVFSFTFIIMFSAILLAKDKQTAFLVRLFTTPLKPSDYIISYILPFLPIALFQILICLTAGMILGATFSNILLTLVLFLIVALICISIGVILGSLFTVNQVSGIGSFLITVIGLFSNIWMDLNMVGGVFKTIGYALPFAHAVEASKALLKGSGFTDVYMHFIVIIIYMVVLFVLAVFSFKRAMKKI